MAAPFLDPYGGDEAAPLVEKRFFDFLYDFQIEGLQPVDEMNVDDPSQLSQLPLKEYQEAVRSMRDLEMTTLFVDFSHLRAYDDTLASTVAAEFYR
jgi:MCM N-terminal domain